MMNIGRSTLSTVLMMVALSTVAEAQAAKKAEDFIPLKVADSFAESDPATKITDRVVCIPYVYKTKSSGIPVLYAGGKISNPTDKPVRVLYHVALFDKDRKLVGSAAQQFDLEAKADSQIGSCFIQAPEPDLARVKFGQWRVYVSDPLPK